MEWVLILVVVGVLAVAFILGRRHNEPTQIGAAWPNNELERLLSLAEKTGETSPELVQTLLESRVVATAASETADKPMTMSQIVSPEM